MWIIRGMVIIFIICIVGVYVWAITDVDLPVDSRYTVPMEHRKPNPEFQTQKEVLLRERMIQTRTAHPKQDFEGSAMLGGAHTLIGDAQWKDHQIVFNQKSQLGS